MNREDVTRWAREADPGFGDQTECLNDSIVGLNAVARFAALVAAAAREECAKVCEAQSIDYGGPPEDAAYNAALKHAADAIRALNSGPTSPPLLS